MKIIQISLTKKQVTQLQDGRLGMDEFALFAQPVISCASMKVGILTVKEFKQFSKAVMPVLKKMKKVTL